MPPDQHGHKGCTLRPPAAYPHSLPNYQTIQPIPYATCEPTPGTHVKGRSSAVIRQLAQIAIGLTMFSKTGHSQTVRPAFHVREVADSALRDVAVAVSDPTDPVIYYNPRLMQRFGPNLSAFVLAHEYGHIKYGHRRVSSRVHIDRDSVMREYELEADCYAARLLAQVKPVAAKVAIEFFQKMGSFRYDGEHPTGTERAARISACLVKEGEAMSVGLGIRRVSRPIPGEPGPMAMLKSWAKLGTGKAEHLAEKPETLVRHERALPKD
jgi:hypothetical protein